MLTREQQLLMLRNLALTMVKSVVEKPEAVEFTEQVMTHNVVVEIYVADSDVGLVLGTRGAHVDAMRTLLNVACKRTDFKYNIDIISKARRRTH